MILPRQLNYKEIIEEVESRQCLLGLKCLDCGSYTFPPTAACQQCGSLNSQTVQLKGEGILKTFTVIRIPPEGFREGNVIGLVELYEGPWVMVNVETEEQADMNLIGRRGNIHYAIAKGDKYSGGKRVQFLFSLETTEDS